MYFVFCNLYICIQLDNATISLGDKLELTHAVIKQQVLTTLKKQVQLALNLHFKMHLDDIRLTLTSVKLVTTPRSEYDATLNGSDRHVGRTLAKQLPVLPDDR